MISLQGPKSRDILEKVTQCDLSNEAFPFSTNKYITVDGHKVSSLDFCPPEGTLHLYYIFVRGRCTEAGEAAEAACGVPLGPG